MTRCRVGIKRADGSVRSMYVHCDGYPKRPGVGWELLNHYATRDLAEALVAVGELSGLGSTLTESSLYGAPCVPQEHQITDWPQTGQEHEYLYDLDGTWLYRSDGKWRYFGTGSKIEADWVPLRTVVEAK